MLRTSARAAIVVPARSSRPSTTVTSNLHWSATALDINPPGPSSGQAAQVPRASANPSFSANPPFLEVGIGRSIVETDKHIIVASPTPADPTARIHRVSIVRSNKPGRARAVDYRWRRCSTARRPEAKKGFTDEGHPIPRARAADGTPGSSRPRAVPRLDQGPCRGAVPFRSAHPRRFAHQHHGGQRA
jgi:hypothetical protein